MGIAGPMTGVRAAVTLGLTGGYAVQVRQARAGLELWAEDDHVDLHVVDDAGSPMVALAAYRAFLAGDFDILVGPYGSGLVRRVAAMVCGTGRLLWNHGGAADDLARTGLVSVLAPASSYLRPLLAVARDRGVESVLLLQGRGPFARQVIDGARREAVTMGLPVSVAELQSWRHPASLAGRALLIAGTFEQDVAAVRQLRTSAVEVEMVGCVAAGIREFEVRLGRLADGVLGPAQWVRRNRPVEVGPAGSAFARGFEARTGRIPDYLAAQAAATGWLAAEATRRGFGAGEVHRWRTTTLLGAFTLDSSWRQAGYTPVVVQWRRGRLEPL
jgi:ABC-type branched-subunit amino acid transport system substrate-binding protein